MCTLFVWYLAITFVIRWQHTSGIIIVCVRICNGTWRTIYTYNNKYRSPKSNITKSLLNLYLLLILCWYPKWEYNHNYMYDIKILLPSDMSISWNDTHNNMCHDLLMIIWWHDITLPICDIWQHSLADVMTWHHIAAVDIMAWHHIYTDIITPFGNKVAPVLLQNSARQPQEHYPISWHDITYPISWIMAWHHIPDIMAWHHIPDIMAWHHIRYHDIIYIPAISSHCRQYLLSR